MPRVNYSDEAFKKTEQVVGKNSATERNINDEYMKNAPQNRDPDNEFINEHKQYYSPGLTKEEQLEETARAVDLQLPTGAPDQTLGRLNKTDDLAEIAQDSLHR